MPTLDDSKSPNYFHIALQSALAAMLFLGLPVGLLLWLILFQQVKHFDVVDRAVSVLQTSGLNSVLLLAICSLGWSFCLGRISRFGAWWKIGLATMIGILTGWFSPLSNLDGWFADKLPIHTLYAVSMCGIVASATICVGIAYGLVLRNTKAAVILPLTTTLVSVLSVLLIVAIFDQFGVRVGTGNFAMSKVTVTSLLLSAITGGAVLGVGFSYFVPDETHTAFPSL